MKEVLFAPNKLRNGRYGEETVLFSKEKVREVHALLRSLKGSYNETPLVDLTAFAGRAQIAKMLVKDESKRGKLKAFKLLGGAYAVANSLCRKLGEDINEVDFEHLKSGQVKEKLGDLVFAAASDGNHGKAVAWAANLFGHSAIVYMPKGTVRDRIEAIEHYGGTVVVSDHSYDWCVSEVSRLSKKKGWEVVLDTASEGDAQVATWVMQGYTVMGHEVIEQLGDTIPTHVFLQAGVGSMAGATAAVFANFYGDKCPKIYTLEPHQAACFYESGLRTDGRAASVGGDMDSIMAGLSCGVPNPISWKILSSFADGFFSCDDVLTANGMRILGNPLPGDTPVISGESGAIGTGFVDHIVRERPDIASQIGLDRSSIVVVFSTEGDTDAQNYRDIVWYGKYPSK